MNRMGSINAQKDRMHFMIVKGAALGKARFLEGRRRRLSAACDTMNSIGFLEELSLWASSKALESSGHLKKEATASKW